MRPIFPNSELIAEAPLRDKLLAHLHEALQPSEPMIVQELPLRVGQSRVDIAVLGSEFSAYELKSDYDTLERLPAQAAAYSNLFDHVTLVVGSRHLAKASAIVPEWWGLMLGFMATTGRIELVTVRPARENPSPDNYALTQLLWRNEALDCLRTSFASRTRDNAPRQLVCDELASLAGRDLIKSLIMSTIINREGQRFA